MLRTALTQLQSRKADARAQIKALITEIHQVEKALKILAGLPPDRGGRGNRGGKISAAGIARIRAAQKARWAKFRAAKKSA